MNATSYRFVKDCSIKSFNFSKFLFTVQYSSTDSKNPVQTTKNYVLKQTDRIQGKIVPKIKTPLVYDDSVKSIKYITPVRAMREYLLTSKDVEDIPKYYSRSPYSYETRMIVLRRTDVEKLAFNKHGSKERFEKLIYAAKDFERKQRAEIFSLKKLNFFSKAEDDDIKHNREPPNIFSFGSGRVVLWAIAINGANFVAKVVLWWITGSKSIFSEALHSLADTINQIIIAYGLRSSAQSPDENHPYGYISMKNITSLISGVGIFCLGSGISFYHAVNGLILGEDIESFQWVLPVMAASFLSESITFIMAYNHAVKAAKKDNFHLKEYIMEGIDPSLNVVLMEDAAAILGVSVAAGAMGLSYFFQSSLPDAFGSLVVSGVIASVAGFIVYTNTDALIGRSIPVHKREAIMKVMEKEKIIRGTYDIKATSIGGDYIKFKAEIDIDGRELTKRYIETIPLDTVLKECQSIETKEELIHFMLNHGDKIVNILGAEVNRIEDNIKKQFPSVKHIDIEVN